MKRWVIIASMLLAGCSTTDVAAPEGKTHTVTVERVVDGDTIEVRSENGNVEDVRMLLIDTPETVHPDKPVQPFGQEASRLTKELLPEGTKVTLERDVSERDKYGRLLAYVWKDDEMINQVLLREGLARVAYVFEPDTRYVDEFRAIEKTARQEERGIWSIENYATDRGFDEALSDDPDCTIKGNINRSGAKLYHLPGGRSYDEVKPEEMFCSEQDARDAGYRRAQ